MNNLPTARVDDILVHPRDNDLIVATHARGIWIADDITALQQATAEARAQDVVLFDIRPTVLWLTDRQRGQYTGGQRHFAGENSPRAAAIAYFLKDIPSDDVKISITDGTGRLIRSLDGTKRAGINRILWNLSLAQSGVGRGGATAQAGTYTVMLEVAGKKLSKPLTLLEDVWMREETMKASASAIRPPAWINAPRTLTGGQEFRRLSLKKKTPTCLLIFVGWRSGLKSES